MLPPLPISHKLLPLPAVGYEVTEWFPMSVNPVHPGNYEVRDGGEIFREPWTGTAWAAPKVPEVYEYWRGIKGAEPPPTPPLPGGDAQ